MKTPKSTTTQDAKTDTPGSSQPTSDTDKVSKVELRSQQCQDAQLMDQDFGTWHDKMISKGHDRLRVH